MLLIHIIIMQMCKPVPKMVPTVSCETRMKEIELKEICIDIDIQLPRFCALLDKMLLLFVLSWCDCCCCCCWSLSVKLSTDLNIYREECKQEEREDCRSTWSKTSASQHHITMNLAKYLNSTIEKISYVKLVKTSLNTKVWASRGDRSAMWANGKTSSQCFHFLK